MEPIKKLFISYSRKDAEWANELYNKLQQRRNIEPWIDKGNITPGKPWWEKILTEIETRQCVLYILSPDSVDSLYCQTEVQYALDLNIPVVPIVLRPCSLPQNLSSIQYLTWNEMEGFLGLLLEIVGILQELSEQDHPRPPSPIERPLRPYLNNELSNPETTHKRRMEIGKEWAKNDERKGVGLRSDGLPNIDWVRVEGADDVQIQLGMEQENRRFAVAPFRIARYPITHIQYQAFLEHPQYNDDRWWVGLKRHRPDEAEQYNNEPKVNVNWFECVAYSRWLTATLPPDGWDESNMRNEGWMLRLPTEWEWQLAATGNLAGYLYPWGTLWDPRHCNSAESHLKTIVAVGLYPNGAAPCGALDMCGNVGEWCLNVYDNIDYVGLEAPSHHQRCQRGGSFEDNQGHLNAMHRFYDIPSRRMPHQGFRLICALPN